jgi:LysR family glycine cleavage system transcriptional activator
MRLPPLNALRAFEAAARHCSFLKAARELHVTPAAISQQVKAVEEHLDTLLFRRLPRRVELTEIGEVLLARLTPAFGQIFDAVAETQARKAASHGSLLISAPPAFGSNWLLARLPRLQQIHPDLQLRIATRATMADAVMLAVGDADDLFEGSDIAIRFGDGHYPGCVAHKLFTLHSTPLCSPALIDGRHPLREPNDLRHHTLLHVQNDVAGLDSGWPKWPEWLAAADVRNVNARRGPVFNQVTLAIEAAADGMGMVLSAPLLAAAELDRGRLMVPFHLSLPLKQAYYLVYAQASAARPEVRAFKEWVLAEAQKECWAQPLGGLQPMRWIP